MSLSMAGTHQQLLMGQISSFGPENIERDAAFAVDRERGLLDVRGDHSDIGSFDQTGAVRGRDGGSGDEIADADDVALVQLKLGIVTVPLTGAGTGAVRVAK